MPMPTWKKRLILIVGLFENLIFTGSILGWSALNYMLKEEGIFSDYCNDNVPHLLVPHLPAIDNSANGSYVDYLIKTGHNPESSHVIYEIDKVSTLPLIKEPFKTNFTSSAPSFIKSTDNHSKIRICHSQERLLNLAYTMGTFFNGFTAFVWGFLLDRWGLRNVRLLINFFLTSGSLTLCFTTRERSYLLFPAITLLCLGGVPLRIADMEIASLFPKRRSFVITLYSGAFSASAITFVLLKFLWDAGLPFSWTCGILVAISLTMLPVTLFLLPSQAIRSEDDGGTDDGKMDKSNSSSEKNDNVIFCEKKLFKRKILKNPATVTLNNITYMASPRIGPKSGVFTYDGGNINPTFIMESIKEKDEGIFFNVGSGGGDMIDRTRNMINNNHNNNHSSDQNNNPNQLSAIIEKGYHHHSSDHFVPTTYLDRKNHNLKCPPVQSQPPMVPKVCKGQIPLRYSLMSIPFLLHQWWFSWLITYMIMYVGVLNLWLSRVTSTKSEASFFTKLYGGTQISALVIAPLAGFWLDHQVNKAEMENDPVERRLKRYKAGFWPLFVTTSTLTGIHVCRFFDTKLAVNFSIFFITFLRAFLVAVGSAFLRIRFPAEHFSKLLGIMSTFGAVISLLQFPLFVWESAVPHHAIWVNVFCCVCTLAAYMNPLLLCFNKFQKKLIAEEDLMIAKG
ncbi:equilibrative nucleobase transporter 1-like isoform X2 [Brevipalpus obovatus]|uniref:equilibrative nucleobase transporter 1-like isoform X2 n=1 Tax=Brevipalpus obovatus TaxID=246614 RepID=UPI003D9E8E2B